MSELFDSRDIAIAAPLVLLPVPGTASLPAKKVADPGKGCCPPPKNVLGWREGGGEGNEVR